MSALEMVLERVKSLDETRARQLLAWLAGQEQSARAGVPLGARAMLGFARRLRSEYRSTGLWMSELREGECD